MSEPAQNIASKSRKHFRDRSPWAKVGIILACTIAGILLLIVVTLLGATLWLTPDRLTKIINTEASKNLDADVTVHNARLSFWSTFPHLCIDIDSMRVISRTLDSIPTEVRTKLPQDASFLMSSGKLHGGINLIKLRAKELWLRELKVDSLELNLVMVSDSISNFDIWHRTGMPDKVPYFTVGHVMLSNPGHLRLFSLPTKSTADINLSDMSLTRRDPSLNSYTLAIKGDIDANVKDVTLLRDFPFNLSGLAQLAFDPFRISLSDYVVNLGNTSGKIDMEFMAGKNPRLNSFSYHIGNFNLPRLLGYFTNAAVPFANSIHSDMIVNMSARLTSPYSFSSSFLPSMEIDFNVPGGEIDYTVAKGETYSLTHSNIKSQLIFNGAKPDSSYINIRPFSVSGDGTNVQLQAHISDLLKDPGFKIAIEGMTDAGLTSKIIAPLRPYALAGVIDTDAVLDFRLSDFHSESLENLMLNGDIIFKNYNIKLPHLNFHASGDNLKLNFGGEASDVTDKTIVNGLFDVKATAGKIKLNANGYDVAVSGLDFSGFMKGDHMIRLSETPFALPYDLDIKAAAVDISNKRDTVKMSVKNILAKGSATTRPGKAMVNRFVADITGEYMDAVDGRVKVTMNDLSSKISANEVSKKIIPPKYVKPKGWTADSLSMDFIGHSPEYLKINLPPKVIETIGKWKSYFSLKVKRGTFLTPDLPLHNGFGNLDIEASFDSVKLNSLHFNSQDTRLKASGKISNLRQFLTSSSIAPLRVALDVAIDTVQINQLCGAYNHGLKLTHGPEASVLTVIPDTLTPSDTVSWLVPRNIVADIRASAMMTHYTDIILHDLSTGLSIRDGKVKIEDLGIASSFGALKLNFEYDTSDIQRMGMNMQGTLAEVNLVNFFRRFHTLLLMMPQMRNLKGNLSAMAEAKLLLFPNMYLNMPSIWADLYVHGDDLLLHQDPFIRRITRMMLIPNSGDIKLADMNIHASVHDNLMELYPFEISFDRYRLQFGGVNNFDGNMYYHLGIDKSPVPFPFGINIIGNFRHPEIRFGGAAFKVKKGQEITASVMEDKCFNLMLELKRLVRKFVEKAAEADTTPASFYVY